MSLDCCRRTVSPAAADGLFHLLLPDCFSLLMLRPLAIDLLITIRYACRREVYPYLIELMKQVG